jgi:UPF0042 nucleotide-binding protein
MHPVTVLSFGYLHPPTPELDTVDITLDLRRLLADPAHVPGADMLDRTGLDEDVSRFVFATPGAVELASTTARLVRSMARLKPVTAAFGCAGGRHRSVALASDLALLLAFAEVDVTVRHLHVHLPRVLTAKRPT